MDYSGDNHAPSEHVQQSFLDIGFATKLACKQISLISDTQINNALNAIAQSLLNKTDAILSANKNDIEQAYAQSLSPAMIDRLTLTVDRITAIAQSLKNIINLPNPVHQILEKIERPNGLIIEKTSVPIGVLGIIYESRPNVTIDAAALCLKSRNCVILRGGSSSFHSSKILHQIIQEQLTAHDIPKECVSMIPDNDRAYVSAMLGAHDIIDVMIPRGGKNLTSRVMTEARMPVFAHLDGNCHIYVDHNVTESMALEVIKNAKLRRTGICGAVESLLFDQKLDLKIMKSIIAMLIDNECTIFGDEATQSLHPNVKPASEQDWATEYLDKTISCRIVPNVHNAIDHINHYGSHHTDCILTHNLDTAKIFTQNVDSAIVMHNSSTQFADGGEFGMGAEIGIGTGKLHARGPVGLKQLVTFKYIVKGNGHIRPL